MVTGTLVVDSFPVFDDDGYTKKSGLDPSTFVVTVLHEGIPISLPITIMEIGTSGEYRYQFTPTVDGYYQVEFNIPYTFDVLGASYEAAEGLSGAVLAYVKDQVDKIDKAPTLGPATVVSGSLMDRMMNKNASKTYNQGTDSLEGIRDRIG